MARTKEEQREYDRERKRKQRESLRRRPFEEVMSLTTRQITISATAKYSLGEMAKRLECTMSDVLSALSHLDSVIMDAWREKKHISCVDELFRKAIERDREGQARWLEKERQSREAQALLKTYKKEEL